MTVAFMTLGCKVNFYETGKMGETFQKAGYQIVDFTERADVYVINTCTVTSVADQKSRKMIRRAKRTNPHAVVAAVGCYAQMAEEALKSNACVDVIVSNEEKEEIVNIVKDYMKSKNGNGELVSLQKQELMQRHEPIQIQGPIQEPGQETTESETHAHIGNRTRAYIKIQDGCNQFCSYCIIPHVRGRIKSKPIRNVVEEVVELVKEGYREIVLSGIHLSSYGMDFNDVGNFVELEGKPLLSLMEDLEQIEGLDRIRLGSLEPRMLTEHFVKRLSKIKKVCPHFHISMQSGSEGTLKRMNRKYTPLEYERVCSRIRRYFMKPAITTDVIAGFPGETKEEFEETKRFIEKMAFSKIHIFKYSARSGTKAATMSNQVSSEEKEERSKELSWLEESLRHAYMESFLGERQKILVEQKLKVEDQNYYVGHNERYVKLAVICNEDKEGLKNEMVEATPIHFLDSEILLCNY